MIAPSGEEYVELSRQARYARRQAAEAKEIGPIPACKDPELRAAVIADPVLFASTCFPYSASLYPLSEDHREVIGRMQRCAEDGGKYVNQVYRSFGKTTIAMVMALWSSLSGRRRFILLLASSADLASELLKGIKSELYGNQMLQDLFPEVCYPIFKIDGKHQKAAHQTCGGVPTAMQWSAKQVMYPNIEGSKAASCVIACESMNASIRGMSVTTPRGDRLRPDWILIDDPQTDASAASATQNQRKLRLFKATIANLGTHFKEIAIVVNGTPIENGDALEVLSDPVQSPNWQSKKIPMLKQLAKNESMWLNEYAEIRNGYNPEIIGDQIRAWHDATEFYCANREQMDEGAVVSWDYCYKPAFEISAIQHAYNMRIDQGEDSWLRECQLAPRQAASDTELLPTAKELCARTNGLGKWVVDERATDVTSFIDVQEACLWWAVCWWCRTNFSGGVCAYGAWPEQATKYYTLSSIISGGRTLQAKYPGGGLESQWAGGLRDLTDYLIGRDYRTPAGSVLRVGKCGIDANYGKSTALVKSFCQSSRWSSVLVPYHGKYVGATSTPFDQYQKRPGEIVGPGWRYTRPQSGGPRHLNADTNAWKSSLFQRLTTAVGDPGAITLYGDNTTDHRMFADQLLAEVPVRVNAKGRTIDEWKERPNMQDNHELDCMTGNMVMASMLGVNLGGGTGVAVAGGRKKVSVPQHMRRG